MHLVLHQTTTTTFNSIKTVQSSLFLQIYGAWHADTLIGVPIN
jgi:hypothetical protein